MIGVRVSAAVSFRPGGALEVSRGRLGVSLLAPARMSAAPGPCEAFGWSKLTHCHVRIVGRGGGARHAFRGCDSGVGCLGAVMITRDTCAPQTLPLVQCRL